MNKLLNTGFILLLASTAWAQRPHTGDPYKNGRIIFEEATALHDKGKFDEAIRLYETVHPSDSLYKNIQYEILLSLYASGNSKETVERGKKLLQSGNAQRFITTMLIGDAYDETGQKDSAILYYSKARELFPYSYRPDFESGILYERKNDYEKAFQAYSAAILKNPYHSKAHLLLGTLAADAGQPGLAALALHMALLMDNNSEKTIQYITTAENIVSGEYKSDRKEVKLPFLENSSAVNELKALVESKAAFSQAFTNELKINYKILRQLQLLCRQLPPPDEQSPAIYTFYHRFFSLGMKASGFPGLALSGYANLEAADFKKAIAKYKKDIEKFEMWMYPWLSESCVVYPNGNDTLHGFFQKGRLKGVGRYNTEGKMIGKWSFYSQDGDLETVGEIVNDLRSGQWISYSPEGNIVSEERFENGKENGPYTQYFENGVLKEKGQFKQGELEGEVLIYHSSTALKYRMNFKNGKRNGLLQAYSPQGVLEMEMEEINAERNGIRKEYHPNGQLSSKANYLKNKREGSVIAYYPNGKIQSEAFYIQDEPNGNYVEYFENGKIKIKAEYDKGKLKGTYTEYFENGKIDNTKKYKNGKLDGSILGYTKDGNPWYDYLYKDGKLLEVKYFGLDGKVIWTGKREGNEFYLKRFSPRGILTSEGKLVEDEYQGVFKFYSSIGLITREEVYEKGLRNGMVREFHPNGKVKSEFYYKDDKIEGFYQTFFRNGNLESEGFYHENELIGPRISYFQNGKIDSKEFYQNSGIWGIDEEFLPDGSTISKEYYYDGVFQGMELIDSTGKVFSKSMLNHGNGELFLKYENGNVRSKSLYQYGKPIDGKKETFYSNGKLLTSEFWKGGKRNGWSESYFENGKKANSGFQYENQRDSAFTEYYPSGAIARTTSFNKGSEEGLETLFFEDPNVVRVKATNVDNEWDGDVFEYSITDEKATSSPLAIMKKFDAGILIGYSYQDKNGQLLPLIELKNGEGQIRAKFTDGKPSVEYQISKGVLQGLYRIYYANGLLRNESNYLDGIQQGVEKDFYPTGTPKEESIYVDGLETGPYTLWYKNGKIKEKGTKLYNHLHGLISRYDETGKLIEKANYRYGDRY